MLLLIKDEIDVAGEIFVSRKTIVRTHIVRLIHSLPDMLHTKGQGVLQLVCNLIRHTLTRYPYRKGKG